MAGEWSTVPLAHIARISSGKRPLRVAKEQSIEFRIPIIGGAGTSGFTDAALFEEEVLVTGRVGTLGKLFASGGPCWPSDNALVIQPSEEGTNARYLRYAVQSVIANATDMNRGAANPLITQGDLGRLAIWYPPVQIQSAIAHILGTLDDKIELNRRMNETLEQMARALFKSWFVDFDPVRAKAAVRREHPNWTNEQVSRAACPNLKPEIAALFPDSFQDSELGEIPKGWEVGTIGELADVSSGKRPDIRFAESSEKATVPLWGGNGPMAFVPEPLVDEPILLTGRVGTLGSVFRITEPCWPSDNTLMLMAKHQVAFEYLYLQLRRIDFDSLNRGSTQPLLTQTDLKSQKLLVPESEIMKCFSSLSAIIYKRIDQLIVESRTLAAIRDALLPKLISGQIRVKDAKRFLSRGES